MGGRRHLWVLPFWLGPVVSHAERNGNPPTRCAYRRRHRAEAPTPLLPLRRRDLPLRVAALSAGAEPDVQRQPPRGRRLCCPETFLCKNIKSLPYVVIVVVVINICGT